MNHISPTTLALSVEDETDRLLATTLASAEAYRELVRRFCADFNRLEWPVTFPFKHFDAHMVPQQLTDTLEPIPMQQLRAMAENKAWQLAENV